MPHRHLPLPRLFVTKAEPGPPVHRLLRGMLAEQAEHPALPMVKLLVAADGGLPQRRLLTAARLPGLATLRPALHQLGAERRGPARRWPWLGSKPPWGARASCAVAIATAIFALLRERATYCGWAFYPPMMPPSFLTMAITEGRGGMPGVKSGQRVVGASKVLPRSSPGCWMARNSVLSSVLSVGPQTSAPAGAW